MGEMLIACTVHERVRVCCAEVDLLTLYALVGLLLGGKHKLGTAIRHLPIWAEECQLVLQCRYIESLVASVVIRWHLVGNLRRTMRVNPLQRFDIGVCQL